jgi:hypothetical protein
VSESQRYYFYVQDQQQKQGLLSRGELMLPVGLTQSQLREKWNAQGEVYRTRYVFIAAEPQQAYDPARLKWRAQKGYDPSTNMSTADLQALYAARAREVLGGRLPWEGPPRTQIVQEWLTTVEEQEVAKRAWDATITACKAAATVGK